MQFIEGKEVITTAIETNKSKIPAESLAKYQY